MWPADMPDDMLEDAITLAKKAMEEHNPEKDGNEVSGCFTHPPDCGGHQDPFR